MAWVTEFARVYKSFGGYKSVLVRGSVEPSKDCLMAEDCFGPPSILQQRHVVELFLSPISKEKLPTTTERKQEQYEAFSNSKGATAIHRCRSSNTQTTKKYRIHDCTKMVVTWKINPVGERMGQAQNPGTESSVRIAFGNVSP